jgi:protocatechuate 3,4-dioxygenase beta subunit
MNKRDFLKTTVLAGAASIMPTNVFASKSETELDPSTVCTLIPSETAGPFPLDLTENTFYFRQDIKETQTGVPFKLKLKINGIGNCGVMQNVRVNIWHCSRLGLYSGYSNAMNAGQAGLTYLRGYQYTDVNGEVEFMTVFPGWYNGRICHIHFQVYVSSAYSAVSQLSFDVATKNAIFLANPTFYPQGADPTAFTSDNVFSNGYALQLATLTPNATTGGYDGYLEVGVNGNGTLGIGHYEAENAKQFKLGQNYPNPYQGETTIPLNLINSSKVKIELYDLNGRNLGAIYEGNLDAGEHHIPFITSEKLATGNYIYQLTLENENGVYKDSKMMTAK